MTELCDRCNFDPATRKPTEEMKRQFPRYEKLCEYDFMTLQRYIAIMKMADQNQENVKREPTQ